MIVNFFFNFCLVIEDVSKHKISDKAELKQIDKKKLSKFKNGFFRIFHVKVKHIGKKDCSCNS